MPCETVTRCGRHMNDEPYGRMNDGGRTPLEQHVASRRSYNAASKRNIIKSW